MKMPDMKDITVVVSVDLAYLPKLWYSYQTWVKFKPEINDMPLLVIFDNSATPPGLRTIPSSVASEAHPDLNVYRAAFQRMTNELGRKSQMTWAPWEMTNAANQREKMLTSLVFGPAEYVQTPWYLKLDADTFATRQCVWMCESWFSGNSPAFIASPWGYTKPGNLLDILDDWGDTVDSLKGFPRLNIPHEPGSETVKSIRMASWVMFGNTLWLKEAVKACPNKKLPVPSQDTFLYYVAARRRDHYVRERMGNFGWQHSSRLTSLVETCERLLGRDALPYSYPLHS